MSDSEKDEPEQLDEQEELDEPEEPMIRFGGEWLPAHDVWKKMETATVVTDAIDRFNNGFPDLASADTRNVVPLVRQRLKDIQLRMPTSDAESTDFAPVASELLDAMSPEDAIEVLKDKHGIEMELGQLIQLVGEQKYLASLVREAKDFELNRISPKQTAQLWNEAGRPAPGGGLWSEDKINKLLNGQP